MKNKTYGTHRTKEYISSLFGDVLPTIKDYENEKGVPDPDAFSLEEYEDFHKLISSWGDEYSGTKHPYKNEYSNWELKLHHTPSNQSFKLGGDQMITGYLQNLRNTGRSQTRDYLNRNIPCTEGVIINDFIRARYSPGNMIFWMRHGNSINQRRANPEVKDRIDLTLESLRRWYEQKRGNDAGYINLKVQFDYDEDYFKLFDTFDCFSKHFQLNSFIFGDGVIDLESSDLSRNCVKLVCDESFGIFPENYGLYLKNAICVIHSRNELLRSIGIV